MGGREGLVDTAVKTAETGYMSRRLMKVCGGGRCGHVWGEGLVDTAVKTAETGYMSRRLMKVWGWLMWGEVTGGGRGDR